MIERAISATEADWPPITAEVTAEELQIALAGMFAMKFMAVRFFPSLQVHALEQLGGADEQLQFIGAITSAARTAVGWQAWHHWGPPYSTGLGANGPRTDLMLVASAIQCGAAC